MKNYVQDGTTLTITAGAATVAGEGVAVGDSLGVAHEDAASGEQLVLQMKGVVTLPANVNVTTLGADLYWDGSELTATAGGNTPAGQCRRVRSANGYADVCLGPTSTPGA